MVSACTVVEPLVGQATVAPAGMSRVLVMSPDIELSEMQASGLLEPKADWTEAAETHVAGALDNYFGARNTTIIRYQPPTEDLAKEQAHAQLINLHGAVGNSILMHKYVPKLILPTKKNKFDWTLVD